ncbi:MAG: adenosylcobinamide-GDP ribazoletransferase [Spirochaetaceae bacterium]
MKRLLYAFRFLTILPIPWKQDEDLNKVAGSIIYFPFVGLSIGIILSSIIYILNPLISPLATASISVLLWILFTGGLHLDGLSDLFDGFGGGNREDRLRIMKDSNIGAFGALSLILLIILKIIFVRELIITDSSKLLFPLILAPTWGRLMQLIVIRFFKSARPDGMGNFFKKSIKEWYWITPLVLTLGLTIYLLSPLSILFILPLILILILFSISVSKKLEGLTGDCYGAICEITELLFIVLYFIIYRSHLG